MIQDADPSWYPKVLETLERDYPEISKEIWAKTITENAIEQNRRREEFND